MHDNAPQGMWGLTHDGDSHKGCVASLPNNLLDGHTWPWHGWAPTSQMNPEEHQMHETQETRTPRKPRRQKQGVKGRKGEARVPEGRDLHEGMYAWNLRTPKHPPTRTHPLHNQMGQAVLRCESKGQSKMSIPRKETRDRRFRLRGSVRIWGGCYPACHTGVCHDFKLNIIKGVHQDVKLIIVKPSNMMLNCLSSHPTWH